MRLVFFDDYRLGVVRDGRVHDADGALDDLPSGDPQARLVALIERFADLRGRIEQAAAGGAGRPLAAMRLRAPVPRPRKLLCAASNYREHGALTKLPIEFFLKSPEAILEPNGAVELPPAQASVFQHEAELAAVIGRSARGVDADAALGCVFGYVQFVDVSARGLQPENYFTGKSFDTFAPIGPEIITADEVPDPQRLRVELDVDDEPRQRFGTDDMANPLAALIAFASAVTTLLPGDVIATGTNHQALSALQDGNRVRMRIEDWAELRFMVHDALGRSWAPGIDEAIAAEARKGR